ncbi:MAG: trigger factor [Deltaproteobacteria bacterium]|nr:trigger factor [Deltaproteobacteria bacterium]
MKVTIEPLSLVQKKITFEIPSERVGEEIEKAYRTFQHSARVKGFRAGKAPRPLLERHFGERVAAEVSSLLVEESYAKALEEHPLQVVARPHIVAEKLVLGQPFRYSATVEVRPDITVTDYEGIEVEKQVRTVEEQEIDSALTRLAESFAQLHPVTDRDRVEQGDVVRLDYTAFVNGRPVPGLQGKGRLVEMEKENVFPGFQEHLLGARQGATTEFSLLLPEPEGPAGGSGRLATFRVTVHELARKEVPPLDDEFAKDHGECATLAELREKVCRSLQQAVDRHAESQMEDELLTQLLSRNPFEVPPSLVQEQEQRLLIEAGVLRPGGDPAAAAATLPESLREEFAARARRQVQVALLLDALAKQLDLSVSEEELDQRIAEFVAATGVERQQQLEAFYARAENRRALHSRLLHEKALRFIVDKARIKAVERGVAGEGEKD